MWNTLEVYARQWRYVFIVLTAFVFITENFRFFSENTAKAWLFLVSGLLWLVALVYIDIRESRRFLSTIRATNDTLHRRTFHPRHGLSQLYRKLGNWLARHIIIIGFVFALGGGLALYYMPNRPWWAVLLVVVGPFATFTVGYIERRSRDSTNLIRQLRPIIKDSQALVMSIQQCARDLLALPTVMSAMGPLSIAGWSSYFDAVGDHQLPALCSVERIANMISPFDTEEINDLIFDIYNILGHVLQTEERYQILCRGLSTLTPATKSAWEYVRDLHHRHGTQLSSLKPLLASRGQENLFDKFINQPPASL